MQAPPRDDVPAQDPGLRLCPTCRAMNGPTVAFCWQCYHPFSEAAGVPAGPGAPGAAGGRGLGGPMPPPPVATEGPRGIPISLRPELAPAPPKRGLGSVLAGILVSTAVAAGTFFFLNRGPNVELPESFGGISQVHSEQFDFLLREFRDEAGRQGIDADMALYGNAGFPSTALVWVQDLSVPGTEDAFDAFATGFNEGLGVGALNRSRSTTEVVEGISYLCAPVDAAQPANVCLWQDEDVFWILLDLSGSTPLSGTQDLAVSAHAATA